MTAVTIYSDFGAQENKVLSLLPYVFGDLLGDCIKEMSLLF